MLLTMKKSRLLAEKTQRQMAEEMGVHVHTYLKWEKNPDGMTINKAKEFCKIVGADIEEIFFDRQSNLIRQNERRTPQ